MTDLPLFDPYKALEEIRRAGAAEAPDRPPQELPQQGAGAIRIANQQVKATSAASAGSAGGSPEHAPTRAREEEERRRKNIIISSTYARDGGPGPGSDVCGRGTPAEVAGPAEVSLSASEQTISPKIEVAEVFGARLREWRDGLARLDFAAPPCPGYRADDWSRVLARMLAFLDEFGPQAEALGWTAPRLFAAHPEIGIVRVDFCGALVLPIGGAVRAITATEISFGHLTHREKPGQVKGPPLWEIGR